jgi:hypothetical protein
MATARIPASTLAEVYNITFGAGAGANLIAPRLILQGLPFDMGTPFASTLDGGGYELPSGHSFSSGELVRLSVPPVSPTPASHPYYWLKEVTPGNIATLSAIGPAVGDAALTATVASLNILEVDLPAEPAAWGLGTQSASPDLVFSTNLNKNEILFGTGERPLITHTASPGVIFPVGWPSAGELVYGVTADSYTLTNSTGNSIVYRHAVLQMGGGGSINQADDASNPVFFPGSADTTILAGASLVFNFKLGIQGGSDPVGGGAGVS